MADNFIIVKPGINVDSKTRVLKHDDYLRLTEASSLLEEARREAARIVAEAEQAYENEKKRGYEDGNLEGKMIMSEQMMDNVSKTITYFESVEEKVTKVVMASLRKILGDMDDTELVSRIVRTALSVVRNQKQVTVRVAPQQFETVRKKTDELLMGFPGIAFLDVVSDSRLAKTDCILESEIGTVEASIDTQLEAISRSLTKCFKRGERI